MRALAAIALTFCAGSAWGQGPSDTGDAEAAWTECQSARNSMVDSWEGWRQDLGGGYSEAFQAYDGGNGAPSMLVQSWLIDAIAILEEESCFRADGTLAVIVSKMTSPNLAADADAPPIVRVGRVAFARDGGVISVRRAILEDGVQVASWDDDRHVLARDCRPAELHPTWRDVRRRMVARLGDLVGEQPAYEPIDFDWCLRSGDSRTVGD